MAFQICLSPLFFHPSHSNTRVQFAKTRKLIRSKHIRARNAVKAQIWSISDQNAATSREVEPSKLHNLNGYTASARISDRVPLDYDREIRSVKQMLQSSKGQDETMESLVLVDRIQRLGISSYFQEEIETFLRQQYVTTSPAVYGSYNLHNISLFFRLLRQHGHYMPPEVFNKFKGSDGRFRRELSEDMRGLMELHEATQLSFHGEYILDEAAGFSSKLLHKYLTNNVGDNCSRLMVTNKLRYPYHKSIARLTEKDFHDFQDYRGTYEWENQIRKLALMDLHKGQIVHQDEFRQVSQWWNELGLTKNLKLARNQPLKWYTWSMAMLLDNISLSAQRVELTKSIAFIYLIDDIFDIYGTLDELTIFTEAVNKWDYATIDTLPDYMKMCYRALLDFTNKIGHTIYKQHGYDPIESLKATWASLCNAFLVEAKWLASGDLPTSDEYLENGKVTSGVHVALVHVFFLLGLGEANKGSIHLNDTSNLRSSVATILRLWDDLGSAKDEHQDGKDGSYIECYRKDYPGSPLAQARDRVVDMIANEWTSLNEECFHLNQPEASSFKRASLNLARMVPLMYSYDENQRLPVLEEYVKFMLFNKTT